MSDESTDSRLSRTLDEPNDRLIAAISIFAAMLLTDAIASAYHGDELRGWIVTLSVGGTLAAIVLAEAGRRILDALGYEAVYGDVVVAAVKAICFALATIVGLWSLTADLGYFVPFVLLVFGLLGLYDARGSLYLRWSR